MRKELFEWITKNFGEEDFLGLLNYTEQTVNKIAHDTRLYRITEVKFTLALPFEEVPKEQLEVWQGELMEIFQVTPPGDRFDIEVDHSKRLVTPGDVDAKLSGEDSKLGDLVEKLSLLMRVNLFRKRPYRRE